MSFLEGLKRYDPFRASPPWTVARKNVYRIGAPVDHSGLQLEAYPVECIPGQL